MGRIQWDSAWNIGHDEIDGQHQRWVELFNELEDAFLSKKQVDMSVVQRNTFKHILEYTRYHFVSEEKYMKDAAFPEIAGHWRLHKEFEKIVYEKFRDFENGKLVLNSELLALIKNWLLRHIQVEDQKFGVYLLANR
jgi:hemerythrin